VFFVFLVVFFVVPSGQQSFLVPSGQQSSQFATIRVP